MKLLNSTLRLMVALSFCVVALCATAQVTVTGTVSDNSGEGLPGVTVRLKSDSNVGVATDIDGNYSLTVPNLNETLTFTYIGYQSQTIALK